MNFDNWLEEALRKAGSSTDDLKDHLESGVLMFVRKAIITERERIANLWAGCTTEAEGHGLVNIGQSIRFGKLIDAD